MKKGGEKGRKGGEEYHLFLCSLPSAAREKRKKEKKKMPFFNMPIFYNILFIEGER